MSISMNELPFDFRDFYRKGDTVPTADAAVYLHNYIHKSIPACLRIDNLEHSVIDLLFKRFTHHSMGIFSSYSRFYGQACDLVVPAGENGNHQSSQSNPDLCYDYYYHSPLNSYFINCLYFVDDIMTIVAIECKRRLKPHLDRS